jgi:asparagine synthase (glutamine-hydrolysing)
MYAFALLDIERKELHLARDPLGIKPLYVASDENALIVFASEIRGLRPLLRTKIEPDPTTFPEFLLNGFLYEPNTGLKGVRKIMPGELRSIDLMTGSVNRTIYYDPLTRVRPEESFEELLLDSARVQSVADVKLGLFFSGGLDSTVVASACQSVEGLFVNYDEAGFGDQTYAREIAARLRLRTTEFRHNPERSGVDAIVEDFRHVARHTEELISDYTYSASALLSAAARRMGYKVMLSGMGGDELFAGYPRHMLARYQMIVHAAAAALKVGSPVLRRHPSMAKKVDRLLRFSSEGNFARAYTNLIGYFSESEVCALLGQRWACESFWGWTESVSERVKHLSPLKQAMYLDRFGFLAHNLMVIDKSSMANSIEVRVPLMSTPLADFGFGLEEREIINHVGGKKPIRSFLKKHLPKRLIDRPKAGFNPPLDGKINSLGRQEISAIMRKGAASDVVDSTYVERLLEAHFGGQSNQTYKIWQLLYFNFWLEQTAIA